MKQLPVVELHTDGACVGNPGPGGWGALLRSRGKERELSDGESLTTNNRMELMAAIAGLEAMKSPCSVRLFTDSQYVMKGATEWMASWVRRGWRTASGDAVKNQDLWQRLEEALRPHQVSWTWIKGHSGHADNERVDKLARAQAERYRDQQNLGAGA